MVSRYGVSKEGAVGVAVGVGPMHCLLPHCGGPHHHHHLSAPHPQNPQSAHNHHVHPAHQPPPSPSAHLNHQLSHHQLTVNINHLSHQQQQQQQTQHQQAPPQYRVVTANARSDFHVSGQNYGTQPGGQVGGGGGSVGVPGGRGPPPLGGLQTIGQSAAGIPPGGPAGGQAPPQAPAPGVQSQQPQGPAPTTTPPVHTPSPQEMGKQTHLQPQPQSLAQVYGPAQARPTSQGYYTQGPRPQQPRGLSHRGGQGGTGAQVVGMSGVGGGGGQAAAIYHTAGLPVQTGAMYQVPNLHPGAHQQSVYPMNSQIPLQYSGPPQRHQTHQNQSFYAPFQHSALLTQNMFGYGAPAPTQPYYWPTGQPTNTPISLSRAGANAVTGGAQHVTGPLAGAQGAPVVPQGTLQQPTQQGQPLPPMGLPLSQTDIYSGHNGGATNATTSTTKSRKPRGQNAITDIVDPNTGKNISHEIYKDNETIQSGESSNRETPQPQNNGAVVQFDSAIRVTKVAHEESHSDCSVPTTSTSDSTTSQSVTQSLTNVQTNSSNDTNSQCNTGPPTPTQKIPNTPALCSQSLGTAPSNVAQTDSCVIKPESKWLQVTAKEFHLKGEIKSNVVVEEPPATTRVVNKDDISVQLSPLTVTDVDTKSTNTITPIVAVASATATSPSPTPTPSSISASAAVSSSTSTSTPTPASTSTSTSTTTATSISTSAVSTTTHERSLSSVPPVSVSTTNASEQVLKSSVTAQSATPLPAREPFPNLSSKTTPSSPPRRKSQTHPHNQPSVTELPPSSAKEQKEKKIREKSLSSRGTTPTPAHNQTSDYHHQKANGDANAEKPEPEAPSRNESQQQKTADGKAMQKQKNKNKLKPRELNRKGAEKEGTDMDAFVNTASTAKSEGKQQHQHQHQHQHQQQQQQQQQHHHQQHQQPQPQQQQPQQQQQQPQQQQHQQQENKEPAAAVKDSNKETGNREVPKEVKEKDNYETKKEKEALPVPQKTEKYVTSLAPEIPKEASSTQPLVIEKLPSNKETVKESSPTVEDNFKPNACNLPLKPVPNDVVDHAKVKDDLDVEAIVAQKNEENSKVSLLRAASEEKTQPPPPPAPVSEKLAEEKQNENEAPPSSETTASTGNQLALKYKYKDGQWSPLNTAGKKVYDREFLMKLQHDPNSKLKPTNLPDLDVVLKDITKARSAIDLRTFKDANMSRHDALYPSFGKPVLNTRMTPSSRKSTPGRSKPIKPTVIHVSLSLKEDVKLRETENAWRPNRMKPGAVVEKDLKTEALYKKVRSVLNKLTPQKFSTLVDQVRSLTIDTLERLQGVINLVFEKAVDEPNFSVAYALMCKELAQMKVSGGDEDEGDSKCNFRKLIIERCQKQYEKRKLNEVERAVKAKEIEECTDPEKKKELQSQLEEEDRKQRVKSVGNTRFIGEMYKQGMLTTKIIHHCIADLLEQNHEDSLECLCKLLTTVGKDLEAKESKNESDEYYNKMEEYFHKMQTIISRRGSQAKISSRIRFMIQDVIDLRANKWIPRRDDSNPKTIDEIQKEAESERLDSQLNNSLLTTPRKDDRNNDRKRNRGIGLTDDGWSQAGGRSSRQTYSVETAKLKNQPPPMADLQLGSRTAYVWKPQHTANSSKTIYPTNKFACLENMTLDQEKRITPPQISGSRSIGPREYGRDYKSSYGDRSSRNGSHQLSSSASSNRDNSMLDNSQSQNASSMSLSSLKPTPQSTSTSHEPALSEDELMKELKRILKEYLKNSAVEKTAVVIRQMFDNAWLLFSRETVNFVLEKSPIDRERVSRLLQHLISQKALPLQPFIDGFCEVLAIVDDLIIDIPKIWTYLADILSLPIEADAIPLAELKPIFDRLNGQAYAGKFLGEVLRKVCDDKGPKWTADKWDQSGLQLNNIIEGKQENIDKIIKEYKLEFLKGDYNSAKSSTSNQLSLQQIHEHLRRLMTQNTFDEICSWIIAHVGNQVKEPKFIRILTTAIMETCIENINGKYQLTEATLIMLQQLIRRFVDANEILELQCLYAIQSYIAKLDYPRGIILQTVKCLAEHNIISNDAFLTWRDTNDPLEREGHGIITMSLTSFFKSLQERGDDTSSVEDVATGMGQDRC